MRSGRTPPEMGKRSQFNASEEDATQAVMALAAGTMDEAGYEAWLGENARRRG